MGEGEGREVGHVPMGSVYIYFSFSPSSTKVVKMR